MRFVLLLLPLLAQGAQQLTFNRDIRPILSDKCFACHGPDAESRKGRLRLDTHGGATRERRGRRAIHPGEPDSSELVERIFAEDESDLMPPPEVGKPLSAEEKATLLRWIEAGADYQEHWAYLPPERSLAPEAQDPDWNGTSIDRFLFASMNAEGLEPAALADPVTLVRRLHFDLTGLPPEPATVEAFVQDPSPARYAGLVSSLLASEHYGERMASYWLDLVRYADTMGYHSDDQQQIFPYRDYVLSAFNSNKGFDEFTREQLAGDLLENATLEQRVASGYNRLNQVTGEGGAQPGEYLAKYMADRIRTTSEVWLGATLGCAECHDHKYDPFTARDFYQFGAFFADLEEVGVYSGNARATGNYPPMVVVPQAGEEDRERELQATVHTLRDRHAHLLTELVATAVPPEPSDWTLLAAQSVNSSGASTLKVLEDGSVLSTGERATHQNYTVIVDVDDGTLAAMRLELLPDASFQGLSRGNGNAVLSGFEAYLVTAAGERPLAFAEVEASAESRGAWHPNGTIDQDPLTGWAAYKDEGEQQTPRSLVFRLREPQRLEGSHQLRIVLRHEADRKHHNVGRFRLAFSANAQAGLLGSTEDKRLRTAILTPRDARSEPERKRIEAHVLAQAPESLSAIAEQILEAEAERQRFDVERAQSMVSHSVEPREVRVLRRGDWLDTGGEVVEPAVPHFLPQPDSSPGGRPTRLDLAEWLLDASNPLTARVFVNRLWFLFYGSGLSNVLNDLGSQGEWPTHPALLDWLAIRFRESGWDIKHMVHLLVTSRAYQLSSAASASQLAIDPANRLHGRQSRRRLQAEFVRDNALAISGLLERTIGGPSAKPYQPAGYWADSYKSVGVPHEYEQSRGRDLYRRGLYTLWKRSFLHPSLLAFDAPLREACVARRPVSNTPLQALALLNDPTYVEAARAFAERALQKGGDSDAQRVDWIVRRALGRAPEPAEVRVLTELLGAQRERYGQNVGDAQALLQVGEARLSGEFPPAELAAWSALTRAVLNLHETITRN